MKHRISGKKLGRTTHQRLALIKGLTRSIFTYGTIETTEAKAKSAVAMVEKAATTAMKGTIVAKQELFKIFQNQTLVNNIVTKMKETFGDQTSNFTKITKVKRRYGDDAVVVKFAFVKPINFLPEVKEDKKEEPQKKVVKAKKVKQENK